MNKKRGRPLFFLLQNFLIITSLIFYKKSCRIILLCSFLVHLQGLEPWTHWLRVSCSTNWAKDAWTINTTHYTHLFYYCQSFLWKNKWISFSVKVPISLNLLCLTNLKKASRMNAIINYKQRRLFMNRLSRKNFIYTGLLLFSMFFGAGNLIFPPFSGNQAGTSVFGAMLGISITAVLFPVLGVADV